MAQADGYLAALFFLVALFLLVFLLIRFVWVKLFIWLLGLGNKIGGTKNDSDMEQKM
jgi:hypothetical protein